MQLPAELTHSQASACLRVLVAQIDTSTATHVEIDASVLQVFDSSALAVLLGCRRAALTAGKTLAVHALPAGLASMAALYGVHALLLPATISPPA